MSRPILSALAGAMALSLAASVCLAGPIEDRQKTMKDVGAAMKVLAGIAEKKSPFDAAVVKEQGEILAAKFTAAKDLFPEGSQKGPPETWAKPEIWSDRAGFEAARQKAHEAATALAAVTEEAKFGEAIGALGNGCKGCHEKFRRPKS